MPAPSESSLWLYENIYQYMGDTFKLLRDEAGKWKTDFIIKVTLAPLLASVSLNWKEVVA